MIERMKPDILLVEDDMVTRAFLTAAIEALPARVEVAASLAEAREHLRICEFDLWLFDANLPDGTGADLLAELRGAGKKTPALAHTAGHEPSTLAALRCAGFADALGKPLTAVALQGAIRTALGGGETSTHSDAGAFPLWNDAAALVALGGQRTHVDALRTLFLGELPGTRDAVERCARDGDEAGLRSLLHRLRASCGFVGANRLDAAVVALQAQPDSMQALRDFLDAAQDTLSPR
jgi:CheY-like chemotaxis protein